MLRIIILLCFILSAKTYAGEVPPAYDATTMEFHKLQSVMPAEAAEYVYLATESLREVVGDKVKYYLADAKMKGDEVVIQFRIPRTHPVPGGGYATITVNKKTKEVKRGLLSK